MRAVRVVQLLFFNLHFPRFVICSNLSSSKNFNFPWLSRTKIKFRDFPGLENEILRFHDFPGFPWPVRTLLPHFTVAQNRSIRYSTTRKISCRLMPVHSVGYTEKFTDHPLPRHMSGTHKFQPAAFYESKKKFFLATRFCQINCYAQRGACFCCSLPVYVTKGSQGTSCIWVAPYKGIQESVASWITRCGFRIPGTGFRIFGPWNVDSGIQWVVGFRIFWVVFRIPKPRISDSTSKNFSTPGVRIPYNFMRQYDIRFWDKY